MEKLTLKLEHCYGIKKLDFEFDFDNRIASIYAPNGAMKTSLAKTFKDISEDKVTQDLIFTDRKTVRHIKKDNNDLEKENVFVISPYEAEYKSEKMSTLLVNKKLREKYDEIHFDLNKKKDALISLLKKQSGLKTNIEEELSLSFTNEEDKIFVALDRIEKEVLDKSEPLFNDILYKKIFNDKVIAFLNMKDFSTKIQEYINKYDELIESSIYFRKGVFNHNNASIIAKNLSDNGFFKARHSVSLVSKDRKKKDITTVEELTEVIEEEKNNIINNPDLQKIFNEIDKKLNANKELREFRDYLDENLKILPELKNIESFRQKLWVSYLKDQKDTFKELIDAYQVGKKEIENIIEQAKKERTKWESVINIFNRRFTVPFLLDIENQENVILKSDAPNIRFSFIDNDEQTPVKEPELLQALSNGEKRALYILNIIFEVEARKENHAETLFVIDDIADSFDYKNKYAIIEYLKEMSQEVNFYQIILAHNFDFFRTIVNRFGLRKQKQAFMIFKTQEKIELIEAQSITPFSYFKSNLDKDNAILIATIPFARNLFEYTKGIENDNYIKLTSLLHIKSDSFTITIKDLEEIFNRIFDNDISLNDKDKPVINLIFEHADYLLKDTDTHIKLQNKIVLSIAIRLKAETFMINKINNSDKTTEFTKNQTYQLIELYQQELKDDSLILELLERVNLMTPENIHINSFMYEPILDMSDEHLKRLYTDISAL